MRELVRTRYTVRGGDQEDELTTCHLHFLLMSKDLPALFVVKCDTTVWIVDLDCQTIVPISGTAILLGLPHTRRWCDWYVFCALYAVSFEVLLQ